MATLITLRGWVRVAIGLLLARLVLNRYTRAEAPASPGYVSNRIQSMSASLSNAFIEGDHSINLKLGARRLGGVAAPDAHAVKRPVHEDKRYKEENRRQHMGQHRIGRGQPNR